MKVNLSFKLITIIVFFSCSSLTSQSSWTNWTKYSGNPVYSHATLGAWDVASDPTVIKDSSGYLLIVSGDGGINAGSIEGNALIAAKSLDGINWTTLANGQNGVVVTGYPNNWDESMEMPDIIKTGANYSLFYCGYDPAVRDSSGGLVWGDLGLAESSDGISFTKLGPPVMIRTPNWYDQDGITDPTIVQHNDTLFMIYVGWCTQACSLNNGNPAFYSLKAISIDYGHTWVKQGLLDPTGIIGLQHPDLAYDADGKYSLFFGVDNACTGGKVGLYHSTGPSPFGPFTPVSVNSIFCMGNQSFETLGTDGGFPTVINDNGTGKMWYTGVDETNFYYKIGLVQSNQTTSTNELKSKENLLVVYPNPSQHAIQIEIPFQPKNAQISIYNELGQIEKNISNINTKNLSLETSTLLNGVYFIIIKDIDKKAIQGKFMVHK